MGGGRGWTLGAPHARMRTMPIRTEPWTKGVPCWADLTATDVNAACRFYAAVLGWEYEQTGPDYGGYVIARHDGMAAAGIGPVQGGRPSAWTIHFACDDADVTAIDIKEAGGQIMAGPMDVGTKGRMVIAVDAQGAPFGAWQAGDFIGAEIYNQPGALGWEDCRCADVDAAKAFYAKVFGFEYEAIEGAPDNDYTIFKLPGGHPLGGVGPQWGAPRPMWVTYFGVEDADGTAAAATANGGTVVSPPDDTPYGRMVTLADTDGANFNVVQPPQS
jgi:predicted enzyme related to lactoylglutathione lyase